MPIYVHMTPFGPPYGPLQSSSWRVSGGCAQHTCAHVVTTPIDACAQRADRVQRVRECCAQTSPDMVDTTNPLRS